MQTPTTEPKSSPFDDPVALAFALSILRRGLKRYRDEQQQPPEVEAA